MAITLRGVVWPSNSLGGQSCTIPAPAGTQVGDFQVLVINTDQTAPNVGISGTTGWTRRVYVASEPSFGTRYWLVYTRTVSGDPTAATTLQPAADYVEGWMVSLDLGGLAYSVVAGGSEQTVIAPPRVTMPSAGAVLYLQDAVIDPNATTWDQWPTLANCVVLGGHIAAPPDTYDSTTLLQTQTVPSGQSPNHTSEGSTPSFPLYWMGATFGFINPPPSAPTPNTPVNNTMVDCTGTVRLGWIFNDPGDSQTAYSLQYRVVGAGSWTTVTGTTDTFRDFPTGSFTAGSQYEWQVQTTDTAGNVSPWSASSFFTAATPPAAPTISTPTAGSTLTGPTQLVTITTSVNLTQLNYRVYGDTGGAPDPNKVIDPGQILVGPAASAKQFTVQGLPNGETVHVEASVFDGNLWSAATDAAYPVLFTPPPTPLASATIGAPTDAAVTIAWTSPTPTGGQPPVESVTVAASPDGGETVEWSQSGLDPSGMVTFFTPASGVDYTITVTGIAANGSTATTTTD